MALINYEDKVALNINPDIPDINKVNASDMNELKNAFNNQVAFGWYKTGLNPTFTFVSWDSTTYTGIVSTNIDLTTYLTAGMKIKFTQNSAIKYAFITAITSTQLTLFLGTDYSLNNSGISDVYYSMLKAPYGFPMNPEKWELSFVRSSNDLYSTTTTTNFYGGANNKLTVPVGVWEIEYNYTIQFASADTSCYSRLALSQSSSEITAGSLASNLVMPLASGLTVSFRFINSKKYNLTEQTTFYLLFKNDIAYSNLYFVGSSALPCWIKAKCSYL